MEWMSPHNLKLDLSPLIIKNAEIICDPQVWKLFKKMLNELECNVLICNGTIKIIPKAEVKEIHLSLTKTKGRTDGG